MKIGYACLTIGVKNSDFKSINKKNINEHSLKEVIEKNLKSLKNIISYNIENNIKMFRITSDLIPFGSSSLNKIKWWDLYNKEFKEISKLIKENNIRVSMHPGQYSVLNSPKSKVVENTIADLKYHCLILDLLETDLNAKIILHIGGVYNDKSLAIERFIDNYKKLPLNVKNRLVIENDDKLYNIEDVLKISSLTGAPVVYDNLHNLVNPSKKGVKTDSFWIEKVNKTWPKDQIQKVHYSQQDKNKNKGAHTKTIYYEDFFNYYKSLNTNVDIMLEVKDKNVSCIKCKNIVEKKDIKKIEEEWARYKYFILERNHQKYLDIREMLKSKKKIDIFKFYSLIEEEIEKEPKNLNGVEHVWGYFKDKANNREKSFYKRRKEEFSTNKEKTILSLKRFLFKLAKKYDNNYLLKSYFFEL